MAGKRYTVTFDRGDVPGQWIASVDEVPGCHTFGKGLQQTRRRIRQALALHIGVVAAGRARLDERLPLPAAVAAELAAIGSLQQRLDELAQARSELADRRRRLVRTLVNRARWSLRDVSQVLGVTFQRVEQLAKAR